MFRSIVFLACLAASPALAQSKEDCPIFGQIADHAARERLAGTEMMDAMVTIAESFTGDRERFAAAVPFLVDWVYNTLPEDQLDSGVGAAYREACEAQ